MKKLIIPCSLLLIGYSTLSQAVEIVRYSHRYLVEGCPALYAQVDYGDAFVKQYPVPANYWEDDHKGQPLPMREPGPVKHVIFYK
jgi:hypothetical protein